MNAVAHGSPIHPVFGEQVFGEQVLGEQVYGEQVMTRAPRQRQRPSEPNNAALRALSERAAALELLETGVEARAVVAAVRPTGTTCNGVPVVALSLVVEVSGEPPRVVVRHTVMAADDRPADRSRPRVVALVDPTDRDNVLLPFDLRPLT